MLTIKRIPTIVSIYQDGVDRPGCGKNCLGTCCIPGAKLPVYAFRGNFTKEQLSDSDSDTPDTGGSLFLDAIILAQWEERLARGLFRYDVTACETKVLPGEFGFIAQLNEGRHLKKRPTEFRVDQVLQAFDPKKFNFSKVGQEEVLFCFEELIDGSYGYSEKMVVGNSPNVVAINVSPIEYGHVLLVPKLLDSKPQQIDQASFRLAVSFAAEAQNPSFRVGYNSLGAFATINHLHFQAYYLAVPFPVERAAVKKMGANKKNGGVKIFELTNYAVNGLVYESNGNLNELADCVARACLVLQEHNVPFNVLIADCGHRIFLFPQCFAEKQALGQVGQDILDTQVNPAVWEISGHIVLKRREDYDSATEDYAWRLLAEVSLSEDRFAEVKRLCLDAVWKQEDVSLKDSLLSYVSSEPGVKISDLQGGGTKQSKMVPVESSVLTENCCA
eukprot:c15074_g1_i1 orf=246-1580(-)